MNFEDLYDCDWVRAFKKEDVNVLMKIEATCVQKPCVDTEFQSKVDIYDFTDSPLIDKAMD
eukprot:4768314-Heterocapsa_arctica.AAC.1